MDKQRLWRSYKPAVYSSFSSVAVEVILEACSSKWVPAYSRLLSNDQETADMAVTMYKQSNWWYFFLCCYYSIVSHFFSV